MPSIINENIRNSLYHSKFWREIIGGTFLAGNFLAANFWREIILAANFWREFFCGNFFGGKFLDGKHPSLVYSRERSRVLNFGGKTSDLTLVKNSNKKFVFLLCVSFKLRLRDRICVAKTSATAVITSLNWW